MCIFFLALFCFKHELMKVFNCQQEKLGIRAFLFNNQVINSDKNITVEKYIRL